MIAATYRPENLGTLTAAPIRYHRCGPGGSETFAITATPVQTVTTPGSVTTSTYEDLDIEQESGAATRTDYLVGVNRITPPDVANKAVTFGSSDQAVLLDPDSGVAVGVADGYATLTARSTDGEVSAVEVSVDISASATSTRWTAGTSGSLNRHCSDQIASRIAGKDRSSMDIWSVRNDATATYQWNPDCWGADLDNITCLSPWNSATGSGGGGCLITPRHVLYCHHLGYHPQVGARVRYVRPDNVTEEFSVTAVLAHPYTAGWVISLHDIVIVKLDRDVPESIKFAKVPPANPKPYLPTIPKNAFDYTIVGSQVQTVYTRGCFTTQFKRLATSFVTRLPNEAFPDKRPGTIDGSEHFYSAVRHTIGAWDTAVSGYPANPLGDNVIIGDSGAPAFMIVNDELVLTNVWTAPGAGYAFYNDTTIVNGMLDTLGGGYTLTAVDTSEFPTYS